MPAPPRSTDPDLYERDFYVWTQVQGAALRELIERRVNLPLDLEHLAEEVEDLGKEQRNAARSQLRRVIEHCLKLEYSLAEAPRRGWHTSVTDARFDLSDRLTPSLRRDLEANLDRLYGQAMRKVKREMEDYGEASAAHGLPAQVPYTLSQLLDEDWFPGLRPT